MEPTGFQNTLSGMYSPAVFTAPGTSLTEAHLFCLLACDRDACCDGFILTRVRGGNVDDKGWETGGPRSQDVQQGNFVGMRSPPPFRRGVHVCKVRDMRRLSNMAHALLAALCCSTGFFVFFFHIDVFRGGIMSSVL